MGNPTASAETRERCAFSFAVVALPHERQPWPGQGDCPPRSGRRRTNSIRSSTTSPRRCGTTPDTSGARSSCATATTRASATSSTYFSHNFERLGLKKLVATCYRSQARDLFSQNACGRAIWLEYAGDRNGNRVPDPEEIGIYALRGDGDEHHLQLRAFDGNTRREVYERQKGVCAICGKRFAFEEMEADHITPWAEGGRTVAENCQMLCRTRFSFSIALDNP